MSSLTHKVWLLTGRKVPLPSLDLNLLTTTLDSRIAFSRAATGPATYYDSNGVLQTARQNLLTNSQAVNSWFLKTDVTVVDNSILSPDGTVNASLVTEGIVSNAVIASNNAAVPAGSTISNSVHVKQGNTPWLRIIISDTGPGFTNGMNIWVNTSTGALGTIAIRGTGTNPSATIQPVGGGWYRVTGTVTLPGGSVTAALGITSALNDNNNTRVNNATYYVWGGQIEVAPSPGPYIVTGAAANGAPRFDADPGTHASLGLLIEEARTNGIINSGAMATSWTAANGTITAASGTAPDGTNTAAFLKEDATNTQHAISCPMVIVSATQYTFSVFAKAAGRSFLYANGMGLAAASLSPQWNLAAGTDVTTGAAANFTHGIQSVGNGWYRCWFSFLTTSTTTMQYILETGVGAPTYPGDNVSGMLLWGAQGEIGAFPTSYIPTGAAAATRPADIATMPTTGWLNAAQGTLAIEAMSPTAVPASSFPGLAVISDGTTNNRLYMTYDTASKLRVISTAGGAAQFDTSGIGSTADFVANAPFRIGLAYKAASYLADFSAATFAALSASTGTVPAGLTTLGLGVGAALTSTSGMVRYLRRVRYWPQALNATQLRQVTS